MYYNKQGIDNELLVNDSNILNRIIQLFFENTKELSYLAGTILINFTYDEDNTT